MIFISGIHGVGKSYFCSKIKDAIGINTYSASSLISEYKKVEFNKDKLVTNIDDNQQFLIMATNALDKNESVYLLDGHFCLLNKLSQVERIPEDTFISLNPQSILVLTDKAETISMRRKERDNIDINSTLIEVFQKEEIQYASYIANKIGTNLMIVDVTNDFDKALQFIQQYT